MIYVLLYLFAIVAANISVSIWGPGVSILNAFLFIALDLTARDKLHDAWQGRNLVWKMGLLIASGSLLSWILNRDAGPIALASFAAFACANVADAIVYHWLREKARLLRVNGSNLVSAGVDSLVFPILAFGWPPLWWVAIGQFAAKVIGGLIWSIAMKDEREKVVA